MESQPGLEIVRLQPRLREALADLFDEIRRRGDDQLFHPHGFTARDAERLCGYSGDDQYYALCHGDRVLGYGMLRGWDAGYRIPSLGILIRADARGRGLGKLLMNHLHSAALLMGAPRIRLKVHASNAVARTMYEGLGYIFEGEEEGQLIGYYTFR